MQCNNCGKELLPAPAKWDGETTFVGLLPCNCRNLKKGTPFNDLKESEQMQIAEQFKKLTQYELRLYRWMKASNGDGWILTNPFDVPLHTARMKL